MNKQLEDNQQQYTTLLEQFKRDMKESRAKDLEKQISAIKQVLFHFFFFSMRKKQK